MKLLLQAVFASLFAILVLSDGTSPFPPGVRDQLYLPGLPPQIVPPPELGAAYFALIVIAFLCIANAINFADVLFMAALLLSGVCLMLGVAVRSAATGGAILMAFMFLAADVWPDNNPVNSSHVIEFFALLGIAYVGPGKFSLQGWVDEHVPLLGKIP